MEPIREVLHFRSQRLDVGAVVSGEVLVEVLELGPLRRRLALDGDLDTLVDEVGDAGEVLLEHAAGGHGGRPDADASGDERRGVSGDAVLVEGDVREVEDALHPGAVDAVGAEVAEDEVVIGPAGDEGVPELRESAGEGGAILDNLLLVVDKFGGGRLLQRHGEGADGVVVGTALEPGEHRAVDRLLVLLLVEDHAASGTSQGLVRGGGDHVRVGEGIVHDVRRDEAADVRHVGHEVGANLVADLPHALVVVVPGVRGRTGDDQLGAVQHGVLFQRVVVDDPGVFVQPVRE